MEFTCTEALPMIGAYLDAELSEPRAGMLRKHLLACPTCRNSVQDGKSIRRWFAPLRAQALDHVPSGFAARVARRAFAGDRGERELVGAGAAEASQGRMLSFVLRATAIAAAAALLLALAHRLQGRPAGTNLSADDRTVMPVTQIESELERLNRGLADPAAPATENDRSRRTRPRAQGERR